MASIRFSKWQGTGNDFIVVDDRNAAFPANDLAFIRTLCDRHFGIGSDGLILVQSPRSGDEAYHMEFFNPDASQSFCGNGSRCAFGFLRAMGDVEGLIHFSAIDGRHSAEWRQGMVTIGMRDVGGVERINDTTDFIHTGSPHLLCWVDDPERIDFIAEAHKHRYSARFRREGVNVNFLAWQNGGLRMRTYERGVEAETLSCGTGVTAAALSAMGRGFVADRCEVDTRGGGLVVEATGNGTVGFTSITLSGPVQEVFNGNVEVPTPTT